MLVGYIPSTQPLTDFANSYIVFVNTSMRDTCALHLSYVLANHSLPEQLLPYVPAAKAGPSTQQLEAYNTISDCQG
jgi:hypothetical protein